MPEPNLRMLRYSKGLSQKELAKAIGVSQTTVTLWEQGKSKPSLGSAVKLANFYAVDLTVISNAINYHFS